MGNSNVKIKRKVQLRRKIDEPKLTDEEQIENPTPQSTPETPKLKTLIWIIMGVVVLRIIGYFIFSKSDNDGQTPVVVEENTEVENISVPSDTTNSGEDVKEETGNIEPELAENSNSNVNGSATSVESAKPAETTTTVSASTSVKTVNVSNDVEAEAMKVIRGDYGIGQERKDRLGAKYQTIQNRVNELKREGVF